METVEFNSVFGETSTSLCVLERRLSKSILFYPFVLSVSPFTLVCVFFSAEWLRFQIRSDIKLTRIKIILCIIVVFVIDVHAESTRCYFRKPTYFKTILSLIIRQIMVWLSTFSCSKRLDYLRVMKDPFLYVIIYEFLLLLKRSL